MRKTPVITTSALALLAVVAFAGPASANGGYAQAIGGVTTVCGAAAGEHLTISDATYAADPELSRDFAAAAAKQAPSKPAQATALRAQTVRNTAAGVSTGVVRDGATATYQAVADSSGCTVVPASGGARDTITVRTAGGKTASVTYNARATYSKAAGIGMRDDGVVAVGADAPARVHTAKTILSASLDNLIVLH